MNRLAAWIRYLYRISEGFRFNLLWRTMLGILNVGLTLTFIWLSKYTIDSVTGNHHCSTRQLIFLIAMMALCLLAAIGISRLTKYYEYRATVKMNIRLSHRLFSGLMISTLDDGRYRFHSGDMLNRLTVDLKSLITFLLTQLPAMVVMLVQLVATFIFLSTLNWLLALVALGVMPVCLLAGKLYFRRRRRLSADIRSSEGLIQVTMQEGLRHRSTLQSLDCVDEMVRRQRALQDKLDDASRHQARLTALSNSMTQLGFNTGFLLAFGWGVFSLNMGLISFGSLTAFIQLVNRLQSPIVGLASYVPAFVNNTVAIDRLEELENFIPSQKGEGCRHLDGAIGLKIKNMTFAYDEASRKIFQDFSYDFAPGSKTVIVGETGAGKSTLVKLFLGLLTPQKGEIDLYTTDREEQASAETRCNFVYVPQGNSLLNGTVRDNLLLADTDATDEDLKRVLHTAAADFVFDLPMGLDTPCDETGNGLSEGQAQRIAIARALLRPGSIMLFDEYNSALDSATAETLTQRIVESYPEATIIFISHRGDVMSYCENVLKIG